MPNVAVIGYGAMAGYVAAHLRQSSWTLSHCIARAGREDVARTRLGASVNVINDVDGLEALPDVAGDCAGHAGWREEGARGWRSPSHHAPGRVNESGMRVAVT